MGVTASWGILGTSKRSKWKAYQANRGGQSAEAPVVTPQTAPQPAPNDTWSKVTIVDWLLLHGVTLSESALMHLTKTELLALVADIMDEETD